MDDKDWIILKTISEERNITKAADRLYLSQPALTYRLKNLEKEFDTKIVLRNPNGVLLTPQGEYLLAYTKEMLLQFQKVKDRIQNTRTKVQGTLRLGSSSIFAHYELPQILKGFLELYPEVEISLKTGLSHKVNRMLQKEEISIAILRGDYFGGEEKYLLREEPICLVSSNPISFAALPKHPRINYVTDSTLQMIVEEWWRQSFSCPSFISMEVDSMDTCRQMVLNGLGWAILPAMGLRQHDVLNTHELHWHSGKSLVRKTWLMYHTTSVELSAVKAFIEYIKETFSYTSRDQIQKQLNP